MIDPLARRIERRMLRIYRECDPIAERGARHLHATCSKGCAACCHLLTLVPLAEAVAIANHLLSDPAWQPRLHDLMVKLLAQLPAYDDDGITNEAHFVKQIPCAFLADDNTCSIYEVRPSACRYHYAVSPPANCSIGAADPTVASIDLRALKQHVAEAAVHVQGQNAREMCAPLPVMMFAVLIMLGDEERGFAENLEAATRQRALNLRTWLGVEG